MHTLLKKLLGPALFIVVSFYLFTPTTWSMDSKQEVLKDVPDKVHQLLHLLIFDLFLSAQQQNCPTAPKVSLQQVYLNVDPYPNIITELKRYKQLQELLTGMPDLEDNLLLSQLHFQIIHNILLHLPRDMDPQFFIYHYPVISVPSITNSSYHWHDKESLITSFGNLIARTHFLRLCGEQDSLDLNLLTNIFNTIIQEAQKNKVDLFQNCTDHEFIHFFRKVVMQGTSDLLESLLKYLKWRHSQFSTKTKENFIQEIEMILSSCGDYEKTIWNELSHILRLVTVEVSQINPLSQDCLGGLNNSNRALLTHFQAQVHVLNSFGLMMPEMIAENSSEETKGSDYNATIEQTHSQSPNLHLPLPQSAVSFNLITPPTTYSSLNW